MVTFSDWPTSPMRAIMYLISARWLAIPNQGYSHFPHNFRSSCEYLIIINVKILVLIKWLYRGPQLF